MPSGKRPYASYKALAGIHESFKWALHVPTLSYLMRWSVTCIKLCFDKWEVVFSGAEPASPELTRPRPVQSVVRRMSGRLSWFGVTPELRDPSSLSSVDLEHQAALTHPKREAQELPDSAASVESRGDSAATVERTE